MRQEILISTVQDCMKSWALDKFGKLPFLLEFSRCRKDIMLQDFTYKIWYESKVLGLFVVLTITKEAILKFLENRFSKSLLNFETLEYLREVSFNVFKDLVRGLDRGFLASLEKICVDFEIKEVKFLRSKGLIKSFLGMMAFYFSFRVNNIGEFVLYLASGPKEFLKRFYSLI